MENNILPNGIVELIRAEGSDLDFGVVTLKIFLRDGRPRWEYSKSISIIDDTIFKDVDVAACLKIKGDGGTNNGL